MHGAPIRGSKGLFARREDRKERKGNSQSLATGDYANEKPCMSMARLDKGGTVARAFDAGGMLMLKEKWTPKTDL